RLGMCGPWSSVYRFAGTVHPNTQGPNLAALCLAAFGLARAKERGRLALWALCGVALALLALTKSRTTTAAIVLALAAVQLMQTPLRTKVAGALALVWLGCLGLWLGWSFGLRPSARFSHCH